MDKNLEKYIEKFHEGHQKMGGTLHLICTANLGSTLLSMFPEKTKVAAHISLQEKYDLRGIWKKMTIPSALEIIDPAAENPEVWKEKIAHLPISITMPIAFIAFSGTVVLSTAHDRSRLLSLLPQRHVVIGNVNQIVWRMEDFWEKFGTEIDTFGSDLSFVTGPSRTADIEKILVRGVHGPHHFEVVMITD